VIEEHFRPHLEPWLLDGTYVGLPAGLRSPDDDRRKAKSHE
jgi:hypothetical protein